MYKNVQDGLEVCTLSSNPSDSQAGWFINVCAVPWMDVKRMSHLPALVCGSKDPTVSFAKSRRAIAGTLKKLQIPNPQRALRQRHSRTTSQWCCPLPWNASESWRRARSLLSTLTPLSTTRVMSSSSCSSLMLDQSMNLLHLSSCSHPF